MTFLSAEVHRYAVSRALVAAGFTDAERAQFAEAWEANGKALTPHQADLLNRYEAFVYPNRGGV